MEGNQNLFTKMHKEVTYSLFQVLAGFVKENGCLCGTNRTLSLSCALSLDE